MKRVVAIFFCVTCSAFVSAQHLERIDKDKLNALKVEPNLNALELDLLPIDSLPLALAPSNDISVYVPTGKMAEMPLMEIKDNINYTLRIKRYNSTYPYTPAKGEEKNQQNKLQKSSVIFKMLHKQE